MKSVSGGIARHVNLLMAWALCLMLSPAANAEVLSLKRAEALALASDPVSNASLAGADALMELAVVARQFQDPRIRLGMVSLPVDTFHLGQEPMTQVQVGVQQQFPRGNSRELGGVAMEQRAKQAIARSRDQQLQLLREVRQLYLEALLQDRLASILQQSAGLFGELTDITTAYYATGRAQQQDVLSVQLQQSRIRERYSSTLQSGENARAGLAGKIGSRAYAGLEDHWPEIGSDLDIQSVKNSLERHPRLQGFDRAIDHAETGVELARQRYKPGFTLDMSYGARGGNNLDGSSRPDFLSVMLTMDVPLFTAKRQDRLVAARVAESSSVAYARDDAWRQLNSDFDAQVAALNRIEERIGLYLESLLPQAEFHAEAALEAYQAATGDLTSLILAQVTEYELRMDFTRLQSERLKTLATLEYLSGESS
jgi:outer membrane protein TolC